MTEYMAMSLVSAILTIAAMTGFYIAHKASNSKKATENTELFSFVLAVLFTLGAVICGINAYQMYDCACACM